MHWSGNIRIFLVLILPGADSSVVVNSPEIVRSDCSPDSSCVLSPVHVQDTSDVSEYSPSMVHSITAPSSPPQCNPQFDFDDVMTSMRVTPAKPELDSRPNIPRPLPCSRNISRPCHRYCSWSTRFKDMQFDGNVTIYRCTKCPLPPDAVTTNVCKPCLSKGVHVEHFDYLQRWRTDDIVLQ